MLGKLKLIRYPFAIAWIYLFCSSVCLATNQGATHIPIDNGKYLQIFIVLFSIIALIFAFSSLLKKFNFVTPAGNGAIHIVSTLPVGTREKITLIQLGEKQILLGVTAQTIQTLHVFEQPVINTTNNSAKKSFQSQLKSLMKKDSSQPVKGEG